MIFDIIFHIKFYIIIIVLWKKTLQSPKQTVLVRLAESEFKEVADGVRKMAKRPNDSEFAELYGLYKQATAGDCNIPRPGDPVGRAKFDAWTCRKGMCPVEAAKKYITSGKAAPNHYDMR